MKDYTFDQNNIKLRFKKLTKIKSNILYSSFSFMEIMCISGMFVSQLIISEFVTTKKS